MDAVNPRRYVHRTKPDRRRPSLHGPHPEHGAKALHPTLSGHGKHRVKPPHSGRPGHLSHRMTCMGGRRRMRRIHCTHRMHRRQCRQRMQRAYTRLRMQCDRPVHLTHCPNALHRTHAEHVPQRKHAAGAFPHPVTFWHSLAACGPCRASLLSVILHPEPVPLRGQLRRLPELTVEIRREGGFYRHMPIASCFFVARKPFRATKKPAPRIGTGGFLLRSRKPYKSNAMAQNKGGRPKAADPKRHIYRFRLNDEQNTRFRQMLSEAGLTDNRSKFILARLFG